jgi:hypothetical protein
MKNSSKFSLLHSAGHASEPVGYTWGDNAVADLGLDEIAQALSIGMQYRAMTKSTLLNLSADAQVIDYRQQVLDDFLSSNGVAAGFEELLPLLRRLRDWVVISNATPK